MYDPSQLYFDPILTGFSLAYAEQNLFGLQLFPQTPVGTKSGRYRVFDRSNWLIYPSRREPGTVAHEIRGAKWSEETFMVKEHSLQAPVHDEENQELTSLGGLADPTFGGALQLNPERDATELVTRALSLEHEKKVADAIRNTANYPAGNFITLAGDSQWDDHTYVTAGIPTSVVSDPVANLRAALRKIKQLTLRTPNVIAIPSQGMEYIENHPRVVERFKTFSLMDDDAWRKLTGFASPGRVIAVDSVYNAADNIDATASMTSFWGKDVFIGIVDATVGQQTATFGKTFAHPYPNGELRPTDRWREEPRKSDLVRNSWNYDLKIVSNIAGFIYKTAFSAGAF